jgi:hypothetical protein
VASRCNGTGRHRRFGKDAGVSRIWCSGVAIGKRPAVYCIHHSSSVSKPWNLSFYHLQLVEITMGQIADEVATLELFILSSAGAGSVVDLRCAVRAPVFYTAIPYRTSYSTLHNPFVLASYGALMTPRRTRRSAAGRSRSRWTGPTNSVPVERTRATTQDGTGPISRDQETD